jgi:hypothetical protein
MIEVIDDFLDPGYYRVLESHLCGPSIPWYANVRPKTLLPGEKSGRDSKHTDGPEYAQTNMSHDVVGGSQAPAHINNTTDFVTPLLLQINEHLGTHGIIRCRMELYSKTNKTDHIPHIDACSEYIHPKDFKTIIFSFNECGNTTIYNEVYTGTQIDEFTVDDIVESKRNRIIMIDGDRFHAGPSEIPCGRRVILNANFYTKKQAPNKINGGRM